MEHGQVIDLLEQTHGSTGERSLQARCGTTERADRFYRQQLLDHLNPRTVLEKANMRLHPLTMLAVIGQEAETRHPDGRYSRPGARKRQVSCHTSWTAPSR